MNERINRLLKDAYSHLGVKTAGEQEKWLRRGEEYLKRDRERYIELADQDTPEYQISIHLGRICRIVPLALKITKEKKETVTVHSSQVLGLMVAGDQAEYVVETASRTESDDPEKESLRFPIYRRTKLEELSDGFQLMEPRLIIPVASRRQREIYGMIFMAMLKFSGQLSINSIPHKTERAVFSIPFAPEQTLQLEGKTVTGKRIALARQESLYDEPRENCRYSYYKELSLLITQHSQQYVMKTHHIYRYFRKVVYDDVPGGCAYEDTEEKQEDTYQTVALEDVRDDLYPLYY